jgi:hypothetical protein
MKPIFGVDVDGILLDMDSAFRRYIQGELQLDLKGVEASRQWDLHTGFGIPKPIEKRMWEEIWKIPLAPCPQAHHFLNGLRERGYDIVAISNRKMGPARSALLRDLQPFEQLSGVIATNDGEEKGWYAEGLRLRGFVDDKLENCWVVGARDYANFDAPPVWLLDRPYNQSHDLRVPYRRVNSLLEILDHV